jgi:hypothetical protein
MHQRILKALIDEPSGLARDSAAGILARQADCSIRDTEQALTDLALRGKIVLREEDGFSRIFASTSASALPASSSNPFPYYLGRPQDTPVLQSLKDFVINTEGTIRIFLSLTAPDAIPGLRQRAEGGRRTVLYLPTKSQCDPKNHYDDILKAWLAFRTNLHPKSRPHLRLRLVSRPLPELETTAISGDLVRINSRSLPSETSRNGVMLSSPAATTLYLAYDMLYSIADASSRPSFRFNPVQGVLHWVRQLAPLTVGLSFVVGAVFLLDYPLVTSSCLGLGTGVIANLITGRSQKVPWQ